MQNTIRTCIQDGLVRSAHDCSEGGLAVALAECCFNPVGPLGAEVDLAASGLRHDEALFNESQSRIILSVAQDKADEVRQKLERTGVAFTILGSVGGEELRIRVSDQIYGWDVTELHDGWFNSIARAVEGDSSSDRIPSL